MTIDFDASPASAPTPAPWVDGPADTIVPALLDSAEALSQSAVADALNAIEALGNFAPAAITVVAPSINVSPPSLRSPATEPSEPAGLTSTFPAAPVEPTLEDIPGLSLGEAPVFDVTVPDLIDVALPDPFDALVPSPPTLDDPDSPVEPEFALPDVPSLLSLSLPDTPTIDIPLFEEVLEDAPLSPDASFAWSEVEYQTAMLSQVNSRLIDFVSGASTGLAPEVEAAIWQRGRDREALLTQRAIDEATKVFASRGFTIPAGTLLRLVQQALQDSIARDAALSREVMMKQAELEQSNFQFSFNLAVQLETALIGHFNTVQSRAFEAQKFTLQSVIQLFNARVQLFQADVQAFGMKAEVFKTRLTAALAQLEAYKAQLEAQRAVAEINKSQVAVYSAQVDGVKALADVYRTRVEAVKTRIDADRNRVEIHRAQLQGYDSLVKAKASEYEGYATRIKAEATKVEMYGQQVAAHKSKADAFGTLVNAKLAEQNFYFKQLQEFPLELYKGRISAYQSAISAEAERLRAVTGVYETRVRSYAASEQAKSAYGNLQVENYRAGVQLYTSNAQVTLAAAEANLKAATTNAETAQASLRAAAQVSGQVAAAALSARHVSASLSSNVSNSSQNSASNSANNSASNSTNRTQGESWDRTRAVPNVSEQHTYREK